MLAFELYIARSGDAPQTPWGICSPEGGTLLNSQLIKAFTRAIDYELLHEPRHLVEHNHSPRFYGLLDRIMPAWRSVKEKLDGTSEVLLAKPENPLEANTLRFYAGILPELRLFVSQLTWW